MKYRTANESGVALIVVLLTMLVFMVMMLGFYFVTTGETKIAASDRDTTIAYYGAVGGLEKMSSDLAAFFVSHVSPTPAQITALTGATYLPNIPGVTFAAGGYSIGQPPTGTMGATLTSTAGTIQGNGPLQGLQGIITPFTLTIIASGPNNTEVKMTRSVQEVAVPVFQYGIFSQSDLSFFAGPNFGFGGRVATNGNLFLAEGAGSTLTLGDRTTAFLDVIRAQISNGADTAAQGRTGTIDQITTAGGCNPAPAGCRALALTEGSVVGGPGSAVNAGPPSWKTLSLTTYAGNIRNGATGVKQLNLALALAGASPIAMIQRPVTVPPGPFEDPLGTVGHDRFINQASVRILLSNTAAAITGLPGVTATAPLLLDSSLNAGATPTLPPDSCHPRVALSPGWAADNDYMSPANTTLLGGYIKIEVQLAATPGTWQDVTAEVLKLGISRDVQASGAGSCPASKQISILHLEEAKPGVTLDSTAKTTTATNFVPINLYDPREGEVRDIDISATFPPITVALNGVMNIIEVDVGNLQKWLANTLCNAGTVPTSCPSGALALNNSGFILYVSDRRGNQDAGGNETGEYGNEDIINPASGTGTPNGVLDAPEDVNGDGVFRTYGATPHPIAVDNSGATKYPIPASTTTLQTFMPAGVTPLDPSKASTRITASEARKNSVVFFRRAVRLVNGTLGNLPPLTQANCTLTTQGGFTVAAENPIYVWGDYNASVANSFNDTAVPPTAGLCHVPAAVIGDAVTLLSNSWTDASSFASPTSTGGRVSTPNDTWYRMAIIGGKNNSFPLPVFTVPAAPPADFGTDGGTHNFLRYIEDWSGVTLHYSGSMVSFYIARQGTGVYKCCAVVYQPPGTRDYAFDTDFSNIQKLPPGTPHFTDVNALSYQQAILSTQ